MHVFQIFNLVNSMLGANVAHIGNENSANIVQFKIQLMTFLRGTCSLRFPVNRTHLWDKFAFSTHVITIHDSQITCERAHTRQACDLWFF